MLRRDKTSTMRGARRCILAIILALPLILAPQLRGQEAKYTVLPLNEKLQDSRYVRQLKTNKSKVLMGSLEFSDKTAALLDAYYLRYAMRVLTDIKQGAAFGDLRIELQKDLASARSKAAHDHVLKKVFSGGKALASSNRFHPITRYNAILMLGDLNEREAVLTGTRPTPPLPLRAALAELEKKFQDVKTPDVVKMGALLGILRHAELRMHPNSPAPLSPPEKERLAESALQLFTTQKVPDGRTAAGHDWMRRRAADLLGRLGLPGSNDSIATALSDSLIDDQAPLALRCAAAEAIGRLDLSKSKLDPQRVARSLGKIAADATAEEVEALADILRSGQAGMGGGRGDFGPSMRPGMESEFGFPGGDEEDKIVFRDERTVPSRRRLIARLDQVRLGLAGNSKMRVDGIAKTLAGADAAVPPILKAVDTLLTNAKDHETALFDLGKALKTEGELLAGQLGDLTGEDRASDAAPSADEPPVESTAAG